MRGAQNLVCECGGFLIPTYKRDLLGKFVKLLACPCGYEKIITMDGDYYRVEIKRNGITESKETYEVPEKIYRISFEKRNRFACRV